MWWKLARLFEGVFTMNKAAAIKFLSATVLSLFVTGAALAENLTVQDSSGFTRAAEDVNGSARIEFNLTGANGEPANNVEVTLTTASGEVIRATAVNGVVVFESVAPGTWTVATATQGITFTNVAITGGTVAAGAAGGLAVGAAVLGVGGGTVAIVAANRDSDDDDDDLSPAS